MGFLDRFKREPKPERSKLLLAMPFFKNGDSYNIRSVVEHLKSFWGLTVTDFNDGDSTAVFSLDGEMVAVAFMDAPIPGNDIAGTAAYAYNWPNALEELEGYTGHAIVSVMAGTKKHAAEVSIIKQTFVFYTGSPSNAAGIYMGTQTLLIPRQQYLDEMQELKEDGTPVLLWIYIGLRKSESGNSVYTYGLKEFGKMEMEIVDSNLALSEIADFITGITAYLLSSNVTFRHGETVGFTQEQKIEITESKGRFVDGQSLKLAM